MDPTKDESGLDYTQDTNCIIHYMASDLPECEELPKLDEIEHKFSGPTTRFQATMQLTKNSNYRVKRNISLVMEGWTMLYLRKTTNIPIPTVYAILTNKTANRDIIIMENIPNPSLEVTWPTLKDAEKENVTKQLAAYFAELRALPSPGFFGRSLPPEFGNLVVEPLPDPLFKDFGGTMQFGGPFETIEQLGKGLAQAIDHNTAVGPKKDFYKSLVLRNLSESPAVFTHGDIQLRNLILKSDGQVVIIDWGNCGWFPAWWDFSVAMFAADFKTDWATYIPKFLSDESPREVCLFFFLRGVWLE